MDEFHFAARSGDGESSVEGSSLEQALDSWAGGGERWLFVTPHDDDLCIGAGLLLQAAVVNGVDVTVIVTTDGRMGYCTPAQRRTIRAVRRREATESFHILGIDDVEWLDFPDSSVSHFSGRRKARLGDPARIAGFTGLQNAYTAKLRSVRPTRVFVPTGNDLHPDHKCVYQELLVSIFHAGGVIWPELGEPIAELPRVYELAVYCEFTGPPALRVRASDARFQKKLAAIEAFRSQAQIERIVDNVRNGGAVEYFKNADFHLYSPRHYEQSFR